MLFDSNGHYGLSHVIFPRTSIYAKDMAFESALKAVQSTHMRNKAVVFGFEYSFLAYEPVYLDSNK